MRGIKAGLIAAFVLALAGCASGGGGTNLRSGVDENADWTKMAKITYDARMRGHQIVWVHPPQKKQPTEKR